MFEIMFDRLNVLNCGIWRKQTESIRVAYGQRFENNLRKSSGRGRKSSLLVVVRPLGSSWNKGRNRSQ